MKPALFSLCCLGFGEVFHSDALAGVGLVMRLARGIGYFHIADEAVTDNNRGFVNKSV